MPESCTDRPTTAHEHIFLLTKSAKYFWDAEAVREPQAQGTFDRYKQGEKIPTFNKTGGSDRKNQSFADATPVAILPNGRNLRTVWEIATHPFPGSHFATFPPELVRRCVAAGTSERGCCPKCGAPWKRVVEKTKYEPPTSDDRFVDASRKDKTRKLSGKEFNESVRVIEESWVPTCTCKEGYWDKEHGVFRENHPCDSIPCTVLDPFSGAGTTALVAAKLGRDAIGIELSEPYVEMSRKRIVGELGMLVEIESYGLAAGKKENRS
jgi:hypothetical protein